MMLCLGPLSLVLGKAAISTQKENRIQAQVGTVGVVDLCLRVLLRYDMKLVLTARSAPAVGQRQSL